MNKLKKAISSLLAFMLVLSLSGGLAFASVAQDVKGTKYQTQAQVLGALGIMVGDANTGNFRPDDSIKRSEATKIGVALLGLTSSANANSGASRYPDVEQSYWANGFINTATTHGLVIGDDTGKFRPEDKIKYSEAVTILIRALGYESQAKAKGGYPTGYITTASSIGLSKGVSASSDAFISRGEVAIMAYNALTIKLMEQTGFGSNIKFEVTNKTLLENKLDVSLIKGKVEAVGSSVLDGGSPLSKNEIRINGKNYNVGKTDVRTILGFNAEAYLNNKTKQIVAIVPTADNEVLNLAAENIASVENSTSKIVNYWKDVNTSYKTHKATVEGDAYIVYNGKIASFDKFANIDSGYMSLLDSDLDGKYEIVFVNETTNYVIEDVYTASQKITDKYSQPTLTLDFEDENKTIILEKAGEYIDLKDLKEWDVITFTISEDSDIIFGNVVTNAITGKITEIGSDHLYVGDQKYKVATNYPHTFSVNDKGTFYIDFEGKIAAFNGEKNNTSNYAYLENIGITGSMNKVLKLEVFTADGKLETLEAASSISVNSSRKLNPQEALSAIGTAGQLITFDKDSSGKINKVYTSTASNEINENKFTMNIDENDVVYRESSSKLIGQNMSVSIADDTIIFDIPQSGNKDDYAVRSKNIFTDGGLYDVMIFDVTENYKAGAVIVTNYNANADEASDIAVVEKITFSKNSNDETVHRLYAYSGGKAINLTSKNELTFKKSNGKLIKEGDIIQLRTNAEGVIDAITVLFDTDLDNVEAKTKISDDLTTVYGRVIKKFSDSINVQAGGSSTENYEISKANVYVYDSTLNKNKISVGDSSDIERYENDGGKVFIRIYKGTVKDIVVIKK
ncbi:MAG: S-layer homology domain-containing protein [Clostridia bacterium]|nr:S-layer homology domain-containing protein [Clostridia bacterium]